MLAELEKLVDEKTLKSRSWARNVRSLGKALARLAPDLLGVGIGIKSECTNSKRCYQIDKVVNSTLHMSLTSHSAQETHFDDAIPPTFPVTDDRKNVTGISGMSVERHWQTSQNWSWNVTAEKASQHEFQENSDDSDDINRSLSNNLTKKRHHFGWMGTVQSVQGNWAEVLWAGETSPTTVGVSELEEIA